jgi:hypothetical protein
MRRYNNNNYRLMLFCFSTLRTVLHESKKNKTVQKLYSKNKLGLLENQKRLYHKISGIKYVPVMRFGKGEILCRYCGNNLSNLSLTEQNKTSVKGQLIDFVKRLASSGMAHRDLHAKNVCWDGEQIWVIDWDFMVEQRVCNIEEHYDLSGRGLESPAETGHMHLFKDHELALKNYLDITVEDFK